MEDGDFGMGPYTAGVRGGAEGLGEENRVGVTGAYDIIGSSDFC